MRVEGYLELVQVDQPALVEMAHPFGCSLEMGEF